VKFRCRVVYIHYLLINFAIGIGGRQGYADTRLWVTGVVNGGPEREKVSEPGPVLGSPAWRGI